MRFTALGLVPFTLLLLACGNDDGSAASPTTQAAAPVDTADEADAPSGTDTGSDSGASDRSGIVVTPEGDYVFTPTTCVVYEDEIEAGGPGTAPDDTPVYVEMDAGEGYANLRIDVGNDDQFTSGDQILISDDVTFDISGSTVSGSTSLRDSSGVSDSFDVTFEINCG